MWFLPVLKQESNFIKWVVIVFGVFFLGVFPAILVHRWLPGSRNSKKSVHLCLQGVALASGVFGIWTKFHGEDGIVANFFSLHSRMGLICISLFAFQNSRPVTKFTEDFDFTAMNEKFKKDEVWGHLGKGNKSQSKDKEGDGKGCDEDDSQDEDDVELSKFESKPVYNKDDFFDSLSSNAFDYESSNGRTRFSEQMKIDTETFGDFPMYRGGRGPPCGGRYRGSYYGRGYGRGYGYVGRGRGRGPSSHAF
ncbi:hypothetical protein F0562_032787 [Nyssa sinensis]|uniref:Cytochrome b561 domain-containing protein n=1 Tax=Nyssa sinensis TaxID=561372 RepID=A0A5J5AQY1_9ASTE|nr:hypothetical protein F0562_032787 [Nyssa sinensis]